ncbi:MAG: VIT domain-containing protein [Archangium sp.]|nr:VIT domain-containing protein [Archangium sp.]MDP3151681.1 VIT domain-containing protein [Archangium sp.]MDP3573199.1 VIT domain-containing protein [Archangium sp.]
MTRLIVLAAVLSAPLAFAQGMLIPTDASMGPLGIKYQRVSAEIVDGAAVTKVEQVFVNSSARQLEAHYVFPLPKGAALQEFYLWINGKRTKGEMLEKKKATDIYEGIVRRLQDPGLLEYVDTDAFRARVFPVPANGEQKIELTFSQVLDFNAGLFQYHYPLGAGTRGAPKLTVKQDFTFSATIKSKTPLRSIYSPTHKLGVSRKGENEAVTGLELGAGADISKDLDLFYTVSDKSIGLTFMSHRPDNEQPGFFMALISPKTDVKADEVISKRVTFVIDTSGSMMGDRMKLARDSLKYCVQKVNPRDEFNVVRFSTDVEALFEKPQLASEANIKKALEFVSGLEAIGGTAIDEAMVRALKDGANRGDRPHMVMFITDGHPTVGETDEAAIAKDAKAANQGSRVFTFGVGDDLNARLLDRMAEEGNGTSDFARDGRDFELKIGGFYDKVANPVLADLALDLSAFGAYDVYPKRLGDLFKGAQLVVMGRYRTPKDGTVVLTGSFNGKKQVFEYRGEATKESKQFDFVPRLWAIRKVGYLLEEIRLRGEKPELKEEIIALGKKYGIVTPYTSYLVVEDTPMPVAQNRPPPPPRMDPWQFRGGGAEEKALAPKGSASGFGGLGGRGAPSSPAAVDAAPSAESSADDFSSAFGRAGPGKAAPKEDAMKKAEGKDGIAMSRAVRKMKEESEGERVNDPVRSASGRTFVYRNGGWIDTEAQSGTSKSLKVKYLSDAYFALLKARPDLKAALALSDRLVIVVGKDKSVIIEPTAGETKPESIAAFLK